MPMPPKDKPPSIKETSFECPYCGVLTSQSWLNIFGQFIKGPGKPFFPDHKFDEYVSKNTSLTPEKKHQQWTWANSMRASDGFLTFLENDIYLSMKVENIFSVGVMIAKK